MFQRFERHFLSDHGSLSQTSPSAPGGVVPSLSAFLDHYGGRSYSKGLYRVISPGEALTWKQRVRLAFPAVADGVDPFAYDWLGRAFALDTSRSEGGAPGVLMLEPGTAEVLAIPANLQSFHDGELVDEAEAALAIGFYRQWRASGGSAPAPDQVIGYRKPLFLGGADEISNLELGDLDVYWHLLAQVIEGIRAR